MFLIAPKFSPAKRCFTVTFRSPGFVQKIKYNTYDEAVIAAIAYYLPRCVIQKALDQALTRDALRIRNLRVEAFELAKAKVRDA